MSSPIQMARFPLFVYLKTAPSITSIVTWDSAEGFFFSNSMSHAMTLDELLVALKPHRLQQTRRAPSSDHLVVALTESLYISWFTFTRYCRPVEGANGNAIMYPQNIPSVAFTIEKDDPPPKPVECTICYEEFVDTVDMPCDHHICKCCWRRMLLNFYSHQVTKVLPYIHCPHETCRKRIRSSKLKSFFSKEEYAQLRAHIRKMREPDLLTARCSHSECRDVCSGPTHSFRNHSIIHLKCRACYKETCYFCEHPKEQCICFRLPAMLVINSPGYISRMYRNRPRNRELTVDDCVNEIAAMLNYQDQPMVMKCPVCKAHISKSTECNEMSHCGVKWCYLCGVMTLPNETFLCDHFGDENCPRYESRSYWQHLGATNYICEEGACYSEFHECRETSHQAGILQKHIIHRMLWLRSYIRFTPRSLRRDVLNTLAANGYEAFVIQLMY